MNGRAGRAASLLERTTASVPASHVRTRATADAAAPPAGSRSLAALERALHRTKTSLEDGHAPAPWLEAVAARTEDRTMIRTTHLRSGAERWPHPSRPRAGISRSRRSSERTPRDVAIRLGSRPSFPMPELAAPVRPPPSETPVITCGAVGLVLFPLAGAAMLGRIVGPALFVAIAAVALTLVYASMARLESSHP